jgi:hypothetical protein
VLCKQPFFWLIDAVHPTHREGNGRGPSGHGNLFNDAWAGFVD